MVTVALCVCTYKRPAGLTRLLEAVAELDFDGQLMVIVVDNDVAREGEAVCERLASTYRWPLACVFEAQRGISFARNCVVAVALEQKPDFIAMLDDDERPCREWLRELLRVQSEADADIVGGPVFPEFATAPPEWIKVGRFFERKALGDGVACFIYGAGNFIARACCFRALLPSPFDVDFALSGGEDHLFFRRLAQRNYTMRWAAHAAVHEVIPPTRMTLKWLKQRQFRIGNTNVRIQRLVAPGARNEFIRLGKTMGLLITGLGLFFIAWPHQVFRTRAILMIYQSFGKIKAHLGIRHLEYVRIHGA